jgi:hypothetical protein
MMLDQGTLTRSKLQWAAEKAKWPDVRRAAQMLIEELERQLTPATARPVRRLLQMPSNQPIRTLSPYHATARAW